MDHLHFEVVVVSGCPAGLMAGIAAARLGSKTVVLEPTGHIGGLPANGLGITDIATRAATRGLFQEFVDGVLAHYAATYGEDSQQVKDCHEGYHFEPHVAETVLEQMVAAEPRLTVLKQHRLAKAETTDGRVTAVVVDRLAAGTPVRIEGDVFIDATYEGDLAAWAGAPYRTGREARWEFAEPFAGKLYMSFRSKQVFPGSTGEGDHRVQAYNFRLCLTDREDLRVPPEQPAGYDRTEYVSLIDDIRSGRIKHFVPHSGDPFAVVNMIRVPNGKSDTNNHHNCCVSTDLPEENYDYPEADYQGREAFCRRQRDYILGLIWFCQHDAELPEAFRDEARQWGLSRDEYEDNDHFPRQIYVREARRIWGEYNFTARDALIDPSSERTPIHPDAITASHYPIDSHATRKREPGQTEVLEGFLGIGFITKPYQVPYGVIVPREVEGLLVPTACSATHMGFGTLRMEPCWMALGQAAGTAAHLSRKLGCRLRELPLDVLQRELLGQGQVLTYFRDLPPHHAHSEPVQYFGTKGFFHTYDARPDEAVDRALAAQWLFSALTLTGETIEPPPQYLPMWDVYEGHPYREAIVTLFGEPATSLRTGSWTEFRPYEPLYWTDAEDWGRRLEFDLPRGLREATGERPYLTRGEWCRILFEITAPRPNPIGFRAR